MNTTQKPIFITGATGSIGFALVSRLSEAGQAVRAVARDEGRAAALRGLDQVETVSGDLGRPASLRGLLDGCGVVYHCAAKVAGSDPTAYQLVNVGGTQALVEEAVRAGVERFVQVSTCTVYGPGDRQMITEDDPWRGYDNPYVVTKRAAEQAVFAAAKKIHVVVARPGDVYGPGQFIWTVNFIEKIKQGLLLPPRDAESGIINLAYIDNLVDALRRMGTDPAAVGQAFNVVDGTPMLVSEYIRCLAAMVGRKPPAVPVFFLRGAAAVLMLTDRLRGREAQVMPGSIDFLLNRSTISNARLRERLGWSPAVSRDEAMRRIEAWVRGE